MLNVRYFNSSHTDLVVNIYLYMQRTYIYNIYTRRNDEVKIPLRNPSGRGERWCGGAKLSARAWEAVVKKGLMRLRHIPKNINIKIILHVIFSE